MIYEREKRFVRVNSKARVNGRIMLESSLVKGGSTTVLQVPQHVAACNWFVYYFFIFFKSNEEKNKKS